VQLSHILLGIAFVGLYGCVSTGLRDVSATTPLGVQIVDDKFNAAIGLSGPVQRIEGKQWNLVTSVGRTTHLTNTTLWFYESYTSDQWKYWYRAADENAKELNLRKIDRNVLLCEGGGAACTYSESLSLDLEDKILQNAAARGFSIKFYSKTGDEYVLSIPAAVAAAQLDAISTLTRSKTASASAN